MTRSRVESVFLCLLFALPLWALVSAKIIAFVMPFLGLLGAYIFFTAPQKKFPRWLWGIYTLLLLFWFSCKWTVQPLPEYLGDMLPTGILLLLGSCVVLGAAHCTISARHFIVLPATWLLLALFLLIEKYTGHSLRKLFYEVSGKELQKDLVSILNKQTCILAFLLLPAIYVAWQSGIVWFRRAFPVVALLATAGILFNSTSQIAQVALVMTVLFLLFPVKLRVGWGLLVFSIGASILLMPWLLAILHDVMLPYATVPASFMGQASAAARLEIWDAIARYLMQSPFTGFGVNATKHIQGFNIIGQFYGGDTIVHPHNFALQFWFEFGVVGALWASLFVTHLVRRLQKFETTNGAKRLLLAASMGILVAAFVGWGIWQGWWVGFLFLYASIWQASLAAHGVKAPNNGLLTA